MNPRDLFFFDTLVTPKIITVLYWLFLLLAVVSSILLMVGNFFFGLVALIGGIVGARLWSELILVAFKINDNLQRIADQGESKDQQ